MPCWAEFDYFFEPLSVKEMEKSKKTVHLNQRSRRNFFKDESIRYIRMCTWRVLIDKYGIFAKYVVCSQISDMSSCNYDYAYLMSS